MTSSTSTHRRASYLRTAFALLLLAGVGTCVWFGGRAYARVKRDEAAFARVGQHQPTALLELRAAEDARLHAGPVSIEAAMQRLATQGRGGLGSALSPLPTSDTAPLMGWAFQPHEVPEWMMAADAGAPSK